MEGRAEKRFIKIKKGTELAMINETKRNIRKSKKVDGGGAVIN